MSPRRLFTILAAVAALGIATDADARGKKRKKKKRAHATQVHKKASNMPGGWTWPPSRAMDEKGKACTAELDALGIAWQPAPAKARIPQPITVPSMELGGVKFVSTYRRGPHVMDCHLALALATHAAQLHALGVREIHFSRIHDYTPVRAHGVTKKRVLSRHALGLAIDLRAFVDDTGHKAVVVDDYPRGDALLLRIENYLNDSGGFRTVLTPKNDPASHHDHFHAEIRVDYTAPIAAGPRS